MPTCKPDASVAIVSPTGPLYGTRASTPSGTALRPWVKYRSDPDALLMTASEPMPRYSLNFLPSFSTILPGDSSVPAKRLPSMTAEAPAASAFAISPEVRMPPSAMTGTLYLRATETTSSTAESCGTPTPEMRRVVQIEPGPTPTLTASANWHAAFAASAVAMLPNIILAFLRLFFIFRALSTTFKLCPCAQSMTMTSQPASSSAFALSAANGPQAAAIGTPAFFTSRTIATCASMEQLRCKTPRPPSFPSVMAILLSVTRSIAAERNGTESSSPAMFVLSDASAGSICEAPGRIKTSSKVKPSWRILATCGELRRTMAYYTLSRQKVNSPKQPNDSKRHSDLLRE